MGRAWALVGCVAAVSLAAPGVRADVGDLHVHAAEPPGDGLYGRWDRDLTLSVEAGGALGWFAGVPRAGGVRREWSVVGTVRARFFDAAGPSLAVRYGPDAGRDLFAAIELRPLFPALFLLDRFTGHERLDLTLQSLGAELGAVTPLDGAGHVAFAWALGVETPLVLVHHTARGLWLRAAVRRVRVHPSARHVGLGSPPSSWTLTLSLAWHLQANLGLARSRE
ncbi:MAG: hypothetical protein KC543_13060 [Myxococcales bacterium]|nr:hypothetical protein [Myxococcales bacterium]